MTILFNRLKEIMDLDNPIEEANKKLKDTYMIINGSLVQVCLFNTEDNNIIVRTHNNKKVVLEVKTIESWVPESGLYPLTTGNSLYLIKHPLRRWEKSFVAENYSISIIGSTHVTNNDIYNEASKVKPVNIFVDMDRNVWYLDKHIGYIKNSDCVVCLDSIFTQELQDWCYDSKN